MTHPILRWIAYAAVQATLLIGYSAIVSSAAGGPEGVAGAKGVLSEDSLLEWSQLAVLGLALTFCVDSARAGGSSVLRVVGALAAVAMVRELDHALEMALSKTGQRAALGVAATALTWLVVWNRRELARDLPGFLERGGFHLMFFGALLVVLYAQLFGQREVWQALTGQGWVSMEKRFVEEGLELMGYAVIACGVFEERFFGGSGRSHGEEPASGPPT